jgi:hypothetical protein
MTRKITQIVALPEGDNTNAALFALCDDGTVWGHSIKNNTKGWVIFTALPQTPETEARS